MTIQTKYITLDDFKVFFGIDLEHELQDSTNPSNDAQAFLMRTEIEVETMLNCFYGKNVEMEYPKLNIYKMAKAGANVIIATHSLDMVKKLELLVKQDPDAEDVVSVQKMPSSKLEVEATLKDKIEEVLEDLSTPFYQMYMEDLE